MYNYETDVDILVNGQPIKKYSHKGNVYVEAKHWNEYSIRVRNNSCFRRLIIVTVDGINVIDGKAGGASKNGYVVNGFTTHEIKGFRTTNEEEHPFKFNSKDRSYAAKSEETKGDSTNCGVIGIQVYAEKEKPLPITNITYHYTPPYIIRDGRMGFGDNTWTGTGDMNGILIRSNMSYPQNLSCSSASNKSVNALFNCVQGTSLLNEEPKKGFDMGTEFSQHAVSSKVVEVEFEIGTLLYVTAIYYASREGLKSMGVPVFKQNQMTLPNPFPNQFCKPPRS